MKKVINLLKNRIDDLDYYKNTSSKKDDKVIEKEIADLNKAIKILEDSERQPNTEDNKQHNNNNTSDMVDVVHNYYSQNFEL